LIYPIKRLILWSLTHHIFDNVHYSQLADLFYYWLNQLLDISTKITTRDPAELQDTDSVLFAKKLTSVFDECNRVLRDDGLFIFTYHHSRHKGWIAVHKAIRHVGFICMQTYPIKAEMSVSMPLQQAKTHIYIDLAFIPSQKSGPTVVIPARSFPVGSGIQFGCLIEVVTNRVSRLPRVTSSMGG